MFSSLLNGSNPIAGPSTHANPAMQRSISDNRLVDDEYDYGDSEAEADESIFRDMTFDEVLEDLNARFMVNLPEEERSLVRLYWQAEQAHWFYEDYLRPLNPHLPSLGQRHFTQLIIASSPLFASLSGPNGIDYDGVWTSYMSYKSMVPCCGAIILNKEGDKCVVVRGWKSSAGWSFPRGKININEPEMLCAIREVEEEIGFDLTGLINEQDRFQTQVNSQSITMYIVAGVDESTVFEAQTKNEIGAIEWVKTSDLPTWTGKKPKNSGGVKVKKFYNVTPFVGPLKKWLQQHGYNPHPQKKKQPPQPAKHPQNNRRNLQLYFEDSSPSLPAAIPAPQLSSHAHEKATSALDHLFDRFITKQAEDLRTGTAEAVQGTDQKEGIRRLFGELGEVSPRVISEDELRRLGAEARESGRREAEDLERLLGALPPPPPSEKASRLLSLLKPAVAQPTAGPSAPPAPRPDTTLDSAPPAMMRPHQASLLSMLSPASRPPAVTQPAVPPPQQHIPPPPTGNPPNYFQSEFPGTSVAAPTSTSPQAPLMDPEAARREKQQKLLEMAFAGISLQPSPGQPAGAGPLAGHHQPAQAFHQAPSMQQSYSADTSTSSYPSHSPVKPANPSPSGHYAAQPAPLHSHHSNQTSPNKRQGQGQHISSTSSPTHLGRHSGSGSQDFGYGTHPSAQHPHQPSHQSHRPQPGMPSEQQRLLATLQARPQQQPGGQPGMGGYGYSRPPMPSGGMPPGPGPARGGYQMGVPGQPGQPQQPPYMQNSGHMPSNLTTNNFPPPLPGQYNLVLQPGGQPGYSHAPPFGGNPGYRPPHPPQPYQPFNAHHHPQPALPTQHHAPVQGQGYGHGQPRHPGPLHNQQPSQGPSQYGPGPGPVRTQQVQNQTVLQPVPVPRQAAMGLLAMINGNAELGR